MGKIDEAYERQKARQREKYANDPEYRRRQRVIHDRWVEKKRKERLEWQEKHPHDVWQNQYYYRNREKILAKAKEKYRLKKQKRIEHEEVQSDIRP